MKYIFLPELHLSLKQPVGRLDNAGETIFEKLTFIFDYAEKIKAVVLSAGDFFDRPRSWYLLPKMIDFLKRYSTVKVYTVYGQHDTYLYHEGTREATSLGILASYGLVTILSNEPNHFNTLYGCNWGEEVPDIESLGFLNILVIHAPIAEESLWNSHEYIDAKKFLKSNKQFDVIFCGDIHRQFYISDSKGRFILNPGPLMRREATDYNFKHKPSFYVYDNEELIKVEIPHKPADEVLSRDHIESVEINNLMLQGFVSSMEAEFETGTDFNTNLSNFIKQNKITDDVVKILSEIMGEE